MMELRHYIQVLYSILLVSILLNLAACSLASLPLTPQKTLYYLSNSHIYTNNITW